MTDFVLFLRNVLLISTAVWMGLTERLRGSPVCDENSVYHYGSKSCLRLFYGSRNWTSRCQQYKGLENQNGTGNVARSGDGDLEGFLRGYLWHLKVPRAAVDYSLRRSSRLNRDMEVYYRLRDPRHFCRNNKSNTIIIMTLAEELGDKVSWEMVCEYFGPAFCQVEGADNATEESGCPSNVTLESVSESNATFYLTPGDIKTQVKVRFSVYQPCNNPTSSLCRNPATKLDEKIFLVNPTTHSVLGLEPNTRYRAQFEIDGYRGRTFVCNETVDFTTNEVAKSQHAEDISFKSEVIGLSVILACFMCATVVFAILYFRLRKQIAQDNTDLSSASVMPAPGKGKGLREVTQVNLKAKTHGNAHSSSIAGTSQTPSNARNDIKPPSKGNNSEFGAYSNVQDVALNYDATVNKLDEHIYEM